MTQIGPHHFSTHGFSGQKCASMWQNFMETVYYPLESTPENTQSFVGTVSAIEMNSMTLTRYRVDALNSVRRPKRDDVEEFIAFLPVRGHQYYAQSKFERIAACGDLVILNAASPYLTRMSDQSETVALKISAPDLRAQIPDIDDYCMQGCSSNASINTALAGLSIETLRVGSSLTTELIGRAGEQILELLCLSLAVGRGTASEGDDDNSAFKANYRRIKAYVEANFRSPTVSADKAARALGISPRYIHRILQTRGMTFGAKVIDRRLVEGDRLLRQPRAPRGATLSIADIAYGCGFSSQSHFTSRYRQKFGCTPREARLGS